MSTASHPADDLPLHLTRQLDTLCDQFEQELQAGRVPIIGVFLRRIDPTAQSRLLAELVGMEWEYWQGLDGYDPCQQVLDRNSDLAVRIRPLLTHLETGGHSTEDSSDASSPVPRMPATQETGTTEGLHVRCPHCHNRLELLVDADLNGIPCPSCGSRFNLSGTTDDPRQAEIITRIGHFELIERLGIGAFGTVWKARDVALDRIVAVKIPRRAESEEDNEKFLREARSAAQLRHPNIVSVHEVGRDQDRIYIISDYIPGESLAGVLERGRMARREGVAIVQKIACALEHAHRKGVIHRDIKPSNVILDHVGQPHITDFGLAKRQTGEVTMTLAGQVLGTPAYMSPEQAQGDAHQAGPPSDIYSLGVLLYQLLTGELPFRGSTAMMLHQAIHEDAPSPRRLDETISRDLETITRKCLEKKPADRYRDAHALAADLACYLRGTPILSVPRSSWQRSWRWGQRYLHQVGLRVAIVGLLCALVVAASSAIWIGHARRLTAAADQKAKRHAAGLAALQYTDGMVAAYSAWSKGWPDQTQRLLEDLQPQSGEPDSRGWAWRLLASLNRPLQPVVLAGHRGAVNELAVFPDRRRVASVGEDGTLRTWDTVTGECLTTIDLGKMLPGIDLASGGLHSVAISPNGRYVAAGADVVGLCDLQRGGQVRELLHADYNVESLAFSSDGERLAAGVRYDEIRLVSLQGEPLARIPCATRVYSIDYLPHQRQWLIPYCEAVHTEHKYLQCWDDGFSHVVRTFDKTAQPVNTPYNIGRISPDGDLLAAGLLDSARIHLLDAKSGKIVASVPQYQGVMSDFRFGPDSRTLAIGFRDGRVCCLRIHEPANGPMALTPCSQVFQAHPECVRSVCMIDPITLATCGTDGLAKIWKPFDTPNRVTLRAEAAFPGSAVFSPDEKRLLALHEWLSSLSSYDAETGKRLAHRSFPTPLQAIWSPSGKRLAVRSHRSPEVRLLDSELQDVATFRFREHVACMDYSPAGDVLATIHPNNIVLSRIEDGQPFDQYPVKSNGSVVKYSHDGTWLAHGSDASIGLRNLKNDERSWTLPVMSTIECVAFSLDDKMFASGHRDGIVRLWQVGKFKPLAELISEGPIKRIFFSPDGRTLICSESDNTTRLWSTAHLRCLGVLDQTTLALSPSGHKAVFYHYVKTPSFPTTFIQSID